MTETGKFNSSCKGDVRFSIHATTPDQRVARDNEQIWEQRHKYFAAQRMELESVSNFLSRAKAEAQADPSIVDVYSKLMKVMDNIRGGFEWNYDIDDAGR
jgi:molecular chaperone GrpE (heat shock protein)